MTNHISANETGNNLSSHTPYSSAINNEKKMQNCVEDIEFQKLGLIEETSWKYGKENY